MAATIMFKSKSLSTLSYLSLYTNNRSPSAISQFIKKVQSKNITTSPVNFVKKIQETTTDNVTVIEGVIHDSDRKDKVIPLEKGTGCCSLCQLNLKLRHTDVLILSQFTKPDGTLLSRRVSGLCALQQKIVECLVFQAQKARLLPTTDRRMNITWKKFNRYFEPLRDGNVAKKYK